MGRLEPPRKTIITMYDYASRLNNLTVDADTQLAQILYNAMGQDHHGVTADWNLIYNCRTEPRIQYNDQKAARN